MNTVTEQRTCPQHGAYMSVLVGERWTMCSACMEAKRKSLYRETLAQEQAGRVKQLAELIDAPPRYETARLSDFAEHPKSTSYLDGLQGGAKASLLIVGPVGTGKTHLAVAMCYGAAERGVRSRYESVGRFLRRVRESWGSRDKTEAQVFEAAAGVPLLVLDEIGIGLKADRDAVRIHELIAERYDRALPTIYVSNLSGDDLKDAVGERAYDRMRHGAMKIAITGESRRGQR